MIAKSSILLKVYTALLAKKIKTTDPKESLPIPPIPPIQAEPGLPLEEPSILIFRKPVGGGSHFPTLEILCFTCLPLLMQVEAKDI